MGKSCPSKNRGQRPMIAYQTVHKVQSRADIVYTGNRMRKTEAVATGSQKCQSNQVPLSVNQLRNR